MLSRARNPGSQLTRTRRREIQLMKINKAKDTNDSKEFKELLTELTLGSKNPDITKPNVVSKNPDIILDTLNVLLYRLRQPPPHFRGDEPSTITQDEIEIITYLISNASVFILSEVAEQLKIQVKRQMASNLDYYFNWLDFILSRPGSDFNPMQICKVLQELMLSYFFGELNVKLPIQSICTFAVAAFNHPDGCNENFPYVHDRLSMKHGLSTGLCDILTLLMRLLTKDETKPQIIDLLCDESDPDSPARRARFIECAIHRCNVVGWGKSICNCPDPIHTADTAMTYINQLDDVMSSVGKAHPILAMALFKNQYYHHLFDAITAWVCNPERFPPAKELRRSNKDALGTVCEITALCLRTFLNYRRTDKVLWKEAHRAVRSLVQEKIAPIAVLVIRYRAKLHGDSQQRAAAVEVISHLITFCSIDLSFPGRLDVAFSSKDVPEYSLSLKRNPKASEWDRLCLAIDAGKVAVRDVEHWGLDLCDNLECPGNRREYRMSKECARCKAVTYCSRACQIVDWHRFHRSECRPDGFKTLPTYSDEFHSSQKTRQYTAALAARKASFCQWYGTPGQRERFDDIKGPRLIMIDGSYTWKMKLVEEIMIHLSVRAENFQRPFHHRLESLLEHYAQNAHASPEWNRRFHLILQRKAKEDFTTEVYVLVEKVEGGGDEGDGVAADLVEYRVRYSVPTVIL